LEVRCDSATGRIIMKVAAQDTIRYCDKREIRRIATFMGATRRGVGPTYDVCISAVLEVGALRGDSLSQLPRVL
jgi:hypothetical protein